MSFLFSSKCKAAKPLSFCFAYLMSGTLVYNFRQVSHTVNAVKFNKGLADYRKFQ